MDFTSLPHGAFTLANVTVPACLVGQEGDLVRIDMGIEAGHIASPGGVAVDMRGAMVLPCFTDMHTHLDKGHIWPRASNPDGTFMGALTTVRADHVNWSEDDLKARMGFSLQCAWAHGTKQIRTHLDSADGQYLRSWPVFSDLRETWTGRIELQAASLVSCEAYGTEEYPKIARTVAEHGGVLGMVTYPVPDIKERLLGHFATADAHGLDVDFHTDETMDASSETLRMIAETVLETGYKGRVVVGHCCSLSTQDEARALDTLDLCARAGLHVVSLPMCNLYLQDRGTGTPRRRGVTLVHEMRARGIPVSFASDNTRDPFYAYGDMDMVEVLREATRIAHLDHCETDWIKSFTLAPEATCGFGVSSLEQRAPADLVIFRARDWTEFFARPQSDRIVMRGGEAIDRKLPDYSDLDNLWKTS
ncbi:cytosine deaminase [Mameliella alba]|uniref:cytosine deaminase n=1 Tax=Mameliella alba TaxID=561184 RepID=UPI0008839220|nr:cytosine deaminase [Mameliella alba]OWV50023.1 cytosine deaminase [Mameliella alba]PTR42600.1 cytosine deaminase [Mameliella alba]GGF72190.1 amidohydrolase [Mameliella alba]SDC17192.1 cytosine deaminase [Mameliella alba]